jgi:hypothetical protein
MARISQPQGVPAMPGGHLSRIHYQLYYRLDADVVEVLALWHDARGSVPDL